MEAFDKNFIYEMQWQRDAYLNALANSQSKKKFPFLENHFNKDREVIDPIKAKEEVLNAFREVGRKAVEKCQY